LSSASTSDHSRSLTSVPSTTQLSRLAGLVMHAPTVYQAGTPLWVVKHSEDPGVPMLHLAYDGQHYDSVRMADDYSEFNSCTSG
jgi:hypothetical protein